MADLFDPPPGETPEPPAPHRPLADRLRPASLGEVIGQEQVLGPENVGLPTPSAPGGGGRIVCNPSHRDYPSLLAEALDVIADAGWELERASLRLDVSKSQLLKLIREHTPAMVKLNEERTALGKHPLK